MRSVPVRENGRALTAEEVCPWCGQPIPHEKFAEITARIRANERARSRDLERRLRNEHEAVLAKVQAVAEQQITKAQKLFEAQAAEAQRKADAEVKAAHKQLRAETDQRVAKQRVHDEGVLKARLREQREAVEKATIEAINAEKARAFAQRQRLETRLTQLQRQVARKGVNDLGEGADVDLYEQLREEFPNDTIVIVNRGQLGAEIVQTVIDNGRACGRIVYDSRSRGAWRKSYVSHLMADKIAAKADHAVLVTAVFPAGQAQLSVQDGVIIANPARAVALVQVIRKHIVQLATLRLTDELREENTARLYDFITSDRCRMLLERMGTVSDKLLDLDVKEHRAHAATWKQRGQLIREVQQARGTLITEIELIVSARSASPSEAT